MCKFAVLPYFNAAPLVHFLQEVCPNAELVYHTPRETLSELTGGSVDAAIIPIVDYLDRPELNIVDGLGICADGAVESVLLQCKCPLNYVRTVNLDPASRTSNLLAELLLKKHFRVRQEIYFCDGASGADASVVIGDRALQAKSTVRCYDLAAEWKKMTGLPFVFAAWGHRNDYPDVQRLAEILNAAKNAGLGAIPELSRLHSKKLGLTESRCNHYLTSCIKYDLGSAERRGMLLFWEFCRSLPKLRRRKIKEETLRTRRIGQNERKNRAIEPIFARIR